MNKNSEKETNSSDLKVSLDDSVKDQPVKKEKLILFSKTKRRRFMLMSSIVLFLYYIPELIFAIWYAANEEYFKGLFKNYSNVGNGYDIACCVILGIIYILVTVLPKQMRNFSISMFILMFITQTYLSAFAIRYLTKERIKNGHLGDYFILVYPMFFCGALATIINILVKGEKKMDESFAATVGSGLYLIIFLVYYFGLVHADPYLWQKAFFFMGPALFSYYLSYDLKMMIHMRNDLYRKNDWFVGMVHLQTDIFFRFWRDLISYARHGKKQENRRMSVDLKFDDEARKSSKKFDEDISSDEDDSDTEINDNRISTTSFDPNNKSDNKTVENDMKIKINQIPPQDSKDNLDTKVEQNPGDT